MVKACLESLGITHIIHYTPLHYLPFIARSRRLKSKPALKHSGFNDRHFRSMSAQHDTNRGFGRYAFLTLDASPRILQAKLQAGFPHVAILVPIETFIDREFYLCRFNVAMTRQLRRGSKPGFPESATNGRYYGSHQIPIAMDAADKIQMLKTHYPAGTMIEVLVPDELPLLENVQVGCFAPQDVEIVRRILRETEALWQVVPMKPPGPYRRRASYAKEVARFVDQALRDHEWRGDGLEFDRV